jgi:hypothetical protein
VVVTCDEDENVNMSARFGFVMSNFGVTLLHGSDYFVLWWFHSPSARYTTFQFALIQNFPFQGIACVVVHALEILGLL